MILRLNGPVEVAPLLRVMLTGIAVNRDSFMADIKDGALSLVVVAGCLLEAELALLTDTDV